MSDMQKDLVLSINEYAYVLDKTKGNVSCWVGPVKTSLSTSDSLVRFNARTKSFEDCSYDEAVTLFTIAPENWYCVLKNPSSKHPNAGVSNSMPSDIEVGRKVNIRGPVSFALFPGQMATVVRGHALRSNQYLLARVYEADAASGSKGEMLDPEGKPIEQKKNKYGNGQILVIKGTEVSFYIPPTGIEVIPVNNNPKNGYVRDAITLERLEYCILKDEDGNKRYVHGPDVVFPEPTETFVASASNSYVFRAIELSPISGIYIKVIAEYSDVDDDGNVIKTHPVGEEMFITGRDQMIYYPRPEHAVINYDGKFMHHAIAIPEGEGRYVMNRLTGEIRTVLGPAMYLPDPRTEVVVKRKLTQKQCDLWYPGNEEVRLYNDSLSENSVIKKAKATNCFDQLSNSITACASAFDMAHWESNASISRGTSYSKPRTIMIDSKYEGVVAIDVWTGYAVNVISKNGARQVMCGPQTVLLDYDQTLEVLTMSTGRPKTTDNLIQTVFLRYENNKVSDIINIETKDFVSAQIKVSYTVNFDTNYQDKWFNVENYVKTLCDRMRSLVKREAKKYTIDEFFQNYSDIVRNIVINVGATKEEDIAHKGRFFTENGMYVNDCEVLSIKVQNDIMELLSEQQYRMVKESLDLTNAEKHLKIFEAIQKAKDEEAQIKSAAEMDQIIRDQEVRDAHYASQVAEQRQIEAEKTAQMEAKKDLQALIDEVDNAELARVRRKNEETVWFETQKAEVEAAKKRAYAETVAKIVESISPDLIAAMSSSANADVLQAVSHAMSPYAIANGQSIAETVNTLMRGTSVEGVLENLAKTK